MLANCFAVGIGGFIGSVIRYLCGFIAPDATFPWVTMTINIVGSFLLALIAGLVLRGFIDNPQIALMLQVGFCGGFTTLSTYCVQMVDMLQNGAIGDAVVYGVITCVVTVLAAFLGTWAALRV